MKMHVPILSAVEKAAQAGITAAAKATLAKSNDLAPKDDGDLIKSGAVRVDDLTAQVSYTAFHAALQHEHLEWQHLDGGQAKFLETAADEVDVGAVTAAAVRAQLGA